MPGKSGPEKVSRQGAGTDIFLLRGAVPIPKPSYGQPRRASYSGSTVSRSKSVDIPHSYYHSKPSLSLSEEPSNIDHTTSSSSGVWSSSRNYNLLEKSSLDTSIEDKSLSQSSDNSGSNLFWKVDNPGVSVSSDSSNPSSIVSNRHRITVIRGKECEALSEEVKESSDIPPPLPLTPSPGQGQIRNLSSSCRVAGTPPPLPSTPIPGKSPEQVDWKEESPETVSTKTAADEETATETVRVLSGLERLRLIEEEQQKGGRNSKQEDLQKSKDQDTKASNREETLDNTTWTATHFTNRRDLFERMASQDTGQAVSESDLRPAHPSGRQGDDQHPGSVVLQNTGTSNSSSSTASGRWAPSDTALEHKKSNTADSDLSVHSLGATSTDHLPSQGSAARGGKVRDGSDDGSDSSDQGDDHHAVLHKTASNEDITFSSHLSPNHEKHYKLHKTSSEEDVSVVKNSSRSTEEEDTVSAGPQEDPTIKGHLETKEKSEEESEINKRMESQPGMKTQAKQKIPISQGHAKETNRKSSPHNLANLVLAELKESFEKPKLIARSSFPSNTPPSTDDRKIKSENIISDPSNEQEKDAQEEMEKQMYEQAEITMHVETIQNNVEEPRSMKNVSSDDKEVSPDSYDMSESLQEFFYHGKVGASTSGYNASEESGSDSEHLKKMKAFSVRKEVKPEVVNSSLAELKAITSSDTRATSPQDGRYIEPSKMEEHLYYFKQIGAEESSGTEDFQVSRYRPSQNKKRKVKGSHIEDDFTASDVGHTTEVQSSQNEADHNTTDDQAGGMMNDVMSTEEKLLQSILSSSGSVKKRDSKVHFDETRLSETMYYKPSETPNLSETTGVDGEMGEGLRRDSSSEEDEPSKSGYTDSSRKAQRSKNKNLRKRNKYPEIYSRSVIGTPLNDKESSSGKVPLSSLPNLTNISSAMMETLKHKLSPDAVKEALSTESQTQPINLSDAASYEISKFISALLLRTIESLASLRNLPEESLGDDPNSREENVEATATEINSSARTKANSYSAGGGTVSTKGVQHESTARDTYPKRKRQEKHPKDTKITSKSVVTATAREKGVSARKPGHFPYGSSPNLSPAVVQALSEQIKPLVMEEIMTIDGQRETMALPESVSDEISRLLSLLLQDAVESMVNGNNAETAGPGSTGFQTSPNFVDSSSAESIQRVETIHVSHGTDVGDKPALPNCYSDQQDASSQLNTQSKATASKLPRKIHLENPPSRSNGSFGKDDILDQLRSSVDHINNIQGMLERASFNDSSSAHSSKSLSLPRTKVEEHLKQLERRSTPITTSPSKLHPHQRQHGEVHTRSCEANQKGNQDVEGTDKSFLKRADLSKRSEKLAVPKTKVTKSTDDSLLAKCKTPEELNAVIKTMKPKKHSPVSDRTGVDLGLERGSSLFSKSLNMDFNRSNRHLNQGKGNAEKTEKPQNKLQATLSWMSQHNDNACPQQTPRQRASYQEEEIGKKEGKATKKYESSRSQTDEPDDLNDPYYLPVAQSTPIPEHVMSSVAKLVFQKHFQDKAISDPQLSPEALEMLFSLLSVESCDEPYEGYDASDSTYSSSVLSSANNTTMQIRTPDQVDGNGREIFSYGNMSPDLTRGSDTLNTSSADSMETNAPSSELQHTSDLEKDSFTQDSATNSAIAPPDMTMEQMTILYQALLAESEATTTDGDTLQDLETSGVKTPKERMIQRISRLYHDQIAQAKSTTDDETLVVQDVTANSVNTPRLHRIEIVQSQRNAEDQDLEVSSVYTPRPRPLAVEDLATSSINTPRPRPLAVEDLATSSVQTPRARSLAVEDLATSSVQTPRMPPLAVEDLETSALQTPRILPLAVVDLTSSSVNTPRMPYSEMTQTDRTAEDRSLAIEDLATSSEMTQRILPLAVVDLTPKGVNTPRLPYTEMAQTDRTAEDYSLALEDSEASCVQRQRRRPLAVEDLATSSVQTPRPRPLAVEDLATSTVQMPRMHPVGVLDLTSNSVNTPRLRYSEMAQTDRTAEDYSLALEDSEASCVQRQRRRPLAVEDLATSSVQTPRPRPLAVEDLATSTVQMPRMHPVGVLDLTSNSVNTPRLRYSEMAQTDRTAEDYSLALEDSEASCVQRQRRRPLAVEDLATSSVQTPRPRPLAVEDLATSTVQMPRMHPVGVLDLTSNSVNTPRLRYSEMAQTDRTAEDYSLALEDLATSSVQTPRPRSLAVEDLATSSVQMPRSRSLAVEDLVTSSVQTPRQRSLAVEDLATSSVQTPRARSLAVEDLATSSVQTPRQRSLAVEDLATSSVQTPRQRSLAVEDLATSSVQTPRPRSLAVEDLATSSVQTPRPRSLAFEDLATSSVQTKRPHSLAVEDLATSSVQIPRPCSLAVEDLATSSVQIPRPRSLAVEDLATSSVQIPRPSSLAVEDLATSSVQTPRPRSLAVEDLATSSVQTPRSVHTEMAQTDTSAADHSLALESQRTSGAKTPSDTVIDKIARLYHDMIAKEKTAAERRALPKEDLTTTDVKSPSDKIIEQMSRSQQTLVAQPKASTDVDPSTLLDIATTGTKSPSEKIIEKMTRSHHTPVGQSQRNIDKETTDRQTLKLMLDKMTSTTDNTIISANNRLDKSTSTSNSSVNPINPAPIYLPCMSPVPLVSASFDEQKSQEVLGTSQMPSSRGASPGADQALSTGRKSAMGSTDMRSYLIEKELIESQLRKLQVENSSLHTENKLLKEKYNRAQVRIQSLETEMLSHRQEAENMHSTMDEISATSRKSRTHNDQERRDLEERVLRLTGEVDRFKAENGSLERQLDSFRRSTDVLKNTSDRSQLIESFREELTAMRGELSKMKELLDQAERDRVLEAEKRKEAAAQVVKLTELKSLLQQQLDNSGGSVAEKQVKSLESRLKITEDRLHQERSDRAEKLSEVEEKLLSENAKLQVTEKDLKRQLQREKDKNRNLDNKYKAIKEDTEKLQIVVADKPASMQNMPYHAKYASLNPSLINKKASDMKYIQDQLKREDNLSANQSEDIIWLLWQRNQELTKCLKQWEMLLVDLGVDYNSITEGLQTLRSDLEMYDDKLVHYKDALDDCKRERDAMEQGLKRQLKDLVHEKHSSQAQIRNVEDQCAAVRAENDSLIHSLRMASGTGPVRPGAEVNTSWEAEVESLKSELHSTKSDLEQRMRHSQRLEVELDSVWTQHRAKEKALDEALDELTRVGSTDRGKQQLEEYQQQKLDKLTAEVRHLEVEACHWREKYESVKRDKDGLEDEISRLHKQLSRAKFTPDGRVMDPSTEAEKTALEEELNDKDLQVMHLTVSYNETENDLQRTKQLLVLQQQSNHQLTNEMDQLQTDVRQKNHLLEKMASSEAEHQVEVASLRENLSSVNNELSKLTEELKLRTIELDHQKSKATKLERDLNSRDALLSSNITEALQDGRLSSVLLSNEMSTAEDTLTHAETQARLLQYEVEKLKHRLEKSDGVLGGLVSENTSLVSKNRHIQQQLVEERARLCQLASEKGEQDQRLHILEDSEKCLIREKACLEQDITKQEVQLANLIDRLEKEAESVQRDYDNKYQKLDQEGKKLAIEFTTVKHLLQAREREIELLRDTIERQKQETSSMGRKLQIMKEENVNNHQQIESLTKDLTRKMKEQDVQKETSQTLASERARLQLEKSQLEQQQNKEHESLQTRLVELQNLQRKLDKSEEVQRQTENLVQQKETDLRLAQKATAQAENEKLSLQNQMGTLNEEVRHLKSVKETLEQRLSLEKNTLHKEKQDRTSTCDELAQAQQQLEVVKREYDILYANMEQESRVLAAVKTQCRAEEEKGVRLTEQVGGLNRDLERARHELQISKETLEQYKQDKQKLCHDIQDLCNQLSEKDTVMARLKDKTEDTVEAMRRDYALEKSYIVQDKQKMENDLYKAREELDVLKEQVKQKEHQLDVFMRTNKDLETNVREKYELEGEVSRLAAELKDSQKSLSRLEADNARLKEATRHLQESLSESRDSATSQKVQIQRLQEELSRETQVLKTQAEEQRRGRERETSQLQETVNRNTLELKSAKASLAAAEEARDSLTESRKSHEKSIEGLKSRLHEETIGRKLAEQRAESVTGQLEEIRGNKNSYSSMTADLQARYAKIEAELNVEKQRFLKLQKEFSELQSSNTMSLATAKSLEFQLSETESENSSLRSQLDSTKQDYSGKNKRLSLEARQTAENYEKDRNKLMAQAQQLSTDLDRTREQLAVKNREQLSLQEEVLTVEAQMREAVSESKHLRESIRLEQETRDKLDRRNMELELLVAKLSGREGSETDSAHEATRAEVQRMLSELSRRMQGQLEQQKGSEQEARERDQRRIEELKQKVCSVESLFSQEQALHIVSKTQLQSLEEDNQRLRQTMQSMRKRQLHSDSSDRTKSRIEAINEIIAKSQTQANQMLASGTFNLDAPDSPFKVPGGLGGTQVQVPNSQYWNLTSSPRAEQNRSLGSEDLSFSMVVNGGAQ